MAIASAVANSMAEKAATAAVDGIWQQIRYVLDYNDNMKDLKLKLQALKDARKRVLHQVEEATMRLQEQIEDDVQTWLKIVGEEIVKMEDILQEDDAARKSCCTGLLPIVKNRHKFSRRAKIEAPVAENMALRGIFHRVGYRVPVQRMVPVKGYEAFESRYIVFESIVKSLKDGDVDKVGVWGLGGVGKTTSAKKIAEQLKAEGIFQSMAIALVGQNPNLTKIQSEIAEWLLFDFEVESFEVRASRLHDRLMQEKSIILIIDDVWKSIELENIGIPIGGDNSRCKILITSRNEKVLLEMGVKTRFRIDVLTNKEARNLFDKNVGTLEDLETQQVAAEIVTRCAGLPILILPVAAALMNRELYEWKDALERLKQFDNQDSNAKAYAALELSYNSLEEDAKSLFMLCAQFAPDDIYIPYLFPHCVALGMFAECRPLQAKMHRLLKVLNDIRSASLLSDGDFRKNHKLDEYFKIHDVVHGFVLSMLSKDKKSQILDYGSLLKKWPSRNDLKNCITIFVPYGAIVELPTILECPELVSFRLWNKDSSLKIPDNFFQIVKDLRVLDLCEINLSPLPSSLQLLTNLRTLRLDYCILGDISIIGELKNLEILILQGSQIAHLPKEMVKLTRLQLLDIRGCEEIKFLPPNVLSCLTQLEQLSMGDSFTKWGLIGSDGQQLNADLIELKYLENLTTLNIKFADLMILSDGLISTKLERFFILIGDCWEWGFSTKKGIWRTLKLKLNTGIRAVEKINLLLKKTEDLYLDSIGGANVDLLDLDWEGFCHLKNLQLQNCHGLRYLVDLVRRGPCTFFPRLESLAVESSQHLEQIYNGSLNGESLSKLRKIRMESCDELRNLFHFSFAKCLSRLEEMEVTDCEKLEGIFVAEDISNDDSNNDEVIQLTMLRRLKLEYLPCLTHVFSAPLGNYFGIHTRKNEPFFNRKIVFPNIEDLTLRSIKVQKIWDHGLLNSYSDITKLTNLVIDGCENVKNVFATSMVASLAQLKVLMISNCKLLEEIITPMAHVFRTNEMKICFPHLEALELKHLQSLVTISTVDLMECSNLKRLWIEDCPRLKTFIANSLSREDMSIISALFNDKVMFPNLEVLAIFNMPSLTMLWHGELHEDSFCKLKFLWVKGVTNLHKLFPSSMLRKIHTLETLSVDDCDSLKEIFDLPKLISEKEKHYDIITMLRRIYAYNLPSLKHIWNGDPQGILSFGNLRQVYVYDCSSLESLFPASIAKQLLRLEELKLSVCSVKQIISKEERNGEVASFVFPNLKLMRFLSLSRLNSFYPGGFTVYWPALKHLSVINCPRLELFKWEIPNTSNTCQLDQLQSSQPLFSFDEVVPELESISLSGKESLMIMQKELPNILSHKLEVLHLHGFNGESANFPINLLDRFPNLERISVGISDFKELFSYQVLNEEKNTRRLLQIKHLVINELPPLEYIWNPQFHLHSILQDLESLVVWNCQSLIHLAPQSASFDNLTTLDVSRCGILASLFTCSTAKSLKQLRQLEVKYCNMLVEVLSAANESDTEISFNKLEILKLVNLGMMTSFCSKKYTLKFCSLVELIVMECPQMEFFCPGQLGAPKLKEVWLTDIKDKSRWKADLNSTMRQLYKERWQGAQDSIVRDD